MSTLSTLEANSLKGALEALLLVSSDPASARRCSPSSRLSTRRPTAAFSCARSPAVGACSRTPPTTTWSRPMC